MQAWSRAMPTISFFDPAVVFDAHPVGLVVKNIDEMCAEILRLKASSALWHTIGERAKRYVEANHRISAVVDHYEQVFRNLSDTS